MTRFPDGLWEYVTPQRNLVAEVVYQNKSSSGYHIGQRNVAQECVVASLLRHFKRSELDEKTTREWLAKGSNQVRLAPLELLLWSE